MNKIHQFMNQKPLAFIALTASIVCFVHAAILIFVLILKH